MGLIERISKIETEVLGLKASQILGSSSAVMVPVYQVDETFTVSIFTELAFRFRSSGVANPLVMPDLQVTFSGTSSGQVTVNYNRYWVAIAFEQLGGQFVAPDEYTAGFVMGLRVPSGSVQVTVRGVIYGTALGTGELRHG